MTEKKEANLTTENFAEVALSFISYFYAVFEMDYSYTKVVMGEYLAENDNSFLDKSLDYSNWHNRDLLLESYYKLIGFIKEHPELLAKLDGNMHHFLFAENCHVVEEKN